MLLRTFKDLPLWQCNSTIKILFIRRRSMVAIKAYYSISYRCLWHNRVSRRTTPKQSTSMLFFLNRFKILLFSFFLVSMIPPKPQCLTITNSSFVLQHNLDLGIFFILSPFACVGYIKLSGENK